MAYEYKKHAMVDDKKYDPTDMGRYYNSAGYHAKIKKEIPTKDDQRRNCRNNEILQGEWGLLQVQARRVGRPRMEVL